MAMFAKEGNDKSDRRPGSSAAGDSPLSIVASGVTVIGDIESNGVIKIEGRIQGSIRSARQVLLGRQGEVRGDINAQEAVIGGKVEGSIITSDRIEVQGTAMVIGDIHTKTIIVLEGARINGQVRMDDGLGTADLTSSQQVAIVR
jgi:cytoskeletal protein CcmA (bactofilin family)